LVAAAIVQIAALRGKGVAGGGKAAAVTAAVLAADAAAAARGGEGLATAAVHGASEAVGALALTAAGIAQELGVVEALVDDAARGQGDSGGEREYEGAHGSHGMVAEPAPRARAA
jgi:hypothetical protein